MWNFKTANWQNFSEKLDKIRWIPPESENYDWFVKAVISRTKKKFAEDNGKNTFPNGIVNANSYMKKLGESSSVTPQLPC